MLQNNETTEIQFADPYSFDDWKKRLGLKQDAAPYSRMVNGIFKEGTLEFRVRGYWHVRVKGHRTFYVAVKYVSIHGEFTMTCMYQLGWLPKPPYPDDFLNLEARN